MLLTDARQRNNKRSNILERGFKGLKENSWESLTTAATRQRQAAELVSQDTKDNCKGNSVIFLHVYHSPPNWNDLVKKRTVPSSLRGQLSWDLNRFQFNTPSSIKECCTRVHRCDVYVMVKKRSAVNYGFQIQSRKRVILDPFKHDYEFI